MEVDIPELVLLRPSRMVVTLFQTFDAIWFHAQYTLLTTLAAFGLAVVVGLALGVLTGSLRLACEALYPLLIGFNPVPKAALVLEQAAAGLGRVIPL